MSEVETTPVQTQEDVAIASLKRQADRLGIQYKSNTSVATLQKLIKEKMDEPAVEDEVASPGVLVSADDTERAERQAVIDKALKLVRVIITPMDSNKASSLESEMFCAGNSLVGTVKRTIPFGVEWHVEEILLNAIREKKYQMFTSKKNAKGAVETTSKLVPAYGITVLDPLTPEELKALADLQARTRSLEDE